MLKWCVLWYVSNFQAAYWVVLLALDSSQDSLHAGTEVGKLLVLFPELILVSLFSVPKV